MVSAVLFPSQWTKEESSRSQITALILGSQRMAKGSALTSGAFSLQQPANTSLTTADESWNWVNLLFFSHLIPCYSLKCIIRLRNKCYMTLLYLSRLFKQNFLITYLIFSSTPTVICQKQRFSSRVLKFWLSDDFKMDWCGTDVTQTITCTALVRLFLQKIWNLSPASSGEFPRNLQLGFSALMSHDVSCCRDITAVTMETVNIPESSLLSISASICDEIFQGCVFPACG